MKIVICGSVNFTPEIIKSATELEAAGHQVEIPRLSEKIRVGEISFDDFLQEKEAKGDGAFRADEPSSLIRRHYHLIEQADAILVINATKNGIEGYIGANTFLEIGFAHALEKKIYLLNPWAKANYSDEITEINPLVIKGDLNLIK
jgi:nucleoside 2-deoxyribosyltransferase